MPAPRRSARGFTYVGLLVAVVIIGLLLTVVSRVWTTTVQREREAQLLWVGHAYRSAIASYYAHGSQFPLSLEQLLQDERSPVPLRHLRQLYADPMTGKPDWILIPDPTSQRIMGVASSSKVTPIKKKGFEPVDSVFANSDCYCKWQFIYWPRRFGALASPDGSVPPAFGPGIGNPTPTPTAPGLLTPGTTTPVPSSGPN